MLQINHMSSRSYILGLLLSLLAACSMYDNRDYRRGERALQAGDYAEAYCLWRPLAEAGHTAAQYSIGWMYANGDGLSLDETEALRWWRRAAEQNHADAQFAVAKAYLNGEGTEVDPAQAVKWLLRASARGVEDAGIILRDMAGRDVAPARDLLRVLLARKRWRELGGVRRIGEKNAKVRSGIGTDRTQVATLERGTEVLALRAEAGWIRIGIPGSGVTGWVYGPLLEGE